MSVKNAIKNNLFFLSTAALAGFALWPMKMTVYLILIWFAAAVYDHLKFKEFSSKRNLKWALIFSGLYIIYLLSFLWSLQSNEAFHTIERKFALLVFPVGFYLFRRQFTDVQVSQILKVYQVTNLLLAAFLYLMIIPMIIEYRDLLTIEGFNYAFRKAIEDIGGIHPTYLSILFLFSIFLQLEWLNNVNETKRKWEIKLSYLHIFLLALLCILLVARGPILSFLIAFTVLLFFRSWKKGLRLLIATLAFFFIIIFFFPIAGNRFVEVVQSTEVNEAQTTISSSSIRKSIHECSKDLIRSNWFKGIGIDHLQNELNRCYARYNNDLLLKSDYNTHNQYFDILLSLGVFGLLLFILMLTYPFYHLTVSQNGVYFFFLLFISLCFLTENLLSRQYGVVFFAFFNTFFAHNLFNKKRYN